MLLEQLNIPDLKIIIPEIFYDHRGYFYESFNQDKFNNLICDNVNFVQDNLSYSKKNTLRGLHYQLPPFGQGKLISVLRGKIQDVAVDLRKSSIFFGKSCSVILSEENKKQFWIPEGFAHGFLTLDEDTQVLYKVTNFYSKDFERSIFFNDPELKINWASTGEILISNKDFEEKLFRNSEYFD